MDAVPKFISWFSSLQSDANEWGVNVGCEFFILLFFGGGFCREGAGGGKRGVSL